MNDRDPTIVIATILNEEGPTGVQAHFTAFRRELETAGHPSLLITPYSAPKILVYPIFAIRRMISPLFGAAGVWWYRHWHALFLQWALRRVLSKNTNSVVYAQCPVSARVSLAARLSAGQPVYMVVHFNHSQADEWSDKGAIAQNGRMARAIRALEARVLPALDGVVYVSRFMQRQLEDRIPRLCAVRNAVIPNFCHRPVRNIGNLEPVDIINVGTLEPRKNQQYLLQVLARAGRMGKRYSLLLVGDGPDRRKLEQCASELGIASQVRFAGDHRRAIELMRCARLYAHSAIMENLPLTLIEAMASGLPIVAPAVGGIPELFAAGQAGIFWRLDNVTEAAELLIRILEDPDALASMSRAAKARFEEEFDAPRLVKRLYEFIVHVDSQETAALVSGYGQP